MVDGVMYLRRRGSRLRARGRDGEAAVALRASADLRVHARILLRPGQSRRGGCGKAGCTSPRLTAFFIRSTLADGHVLWKADTIVERTRGYTITGAPQVAGNVVVIGNGGAELDARGYMHGSHKLDDGAQARRFFTVPGDPSKPVEHPELEQAAKTWDPNRQEVATGGGGTAWDSMAWDPELNLLYVGTGNGAPWNREVRRPKGGDNLFLSPLLAINPDTGEISCWYYQEVPGEQWDYTALQHIKLATLTIGGQPRKVLMHAPKNGFFYVLDR